MRLNYYEFPEDFTDEKVMSDVCGYYIDEEDHIAPYNFVGGLSVSIVKDLIKQYGGKGYTQHIDRDGSVFEVTEIKVSGNNSKHKYNKHL
jgi:hypothetical protein